VSESLNLASIDLMYASCKSEIVHASRLCVIWMPSNQLTGPESVSAYCLCSFPLYTAISFAELPVFVQSFMCTTSNRTLSPICAMNTPGSTLVTQKPRSVSTQYSASYHLWPACFSPYNAFSSLFVTTTGSQLPVMDSHYL
jgi:hypothetical protein